MNYFLFIKNLEKQSNSYFKIIIRLKLIKSTQVDISNNFMKAKYLLPLSIFTAVTLGAILASGKSTVASESIFNCQLDRSMATTIAKTINGKEKAVFHWNNLESETTQTNLKQLCNSVTQKLNNYLSNGNDLSSLTFKASAVFDDDESNILPAVCIAGEEESCKLLLFTLKPSEKPGVDANNALTSILDKNLQASPVESPTRGIQSTAYEVTFWDLFRL